MLDSLLITEVTRMRCILFFFKECKFRHSNLMMKSEKRLNRATLPILPSSRRNMSI